MGGRLVFGIGINDVDYAVTEYGFVDGKSKRERIWQCPKYKNWKSGLQRCFDKKWIQANPTYDGCIWTEDWIRLSKFVCWRDTYAETHGSVDGKHLDKDIILLGNKLYSPETCAYVWPATNTFVIDCAAVRGAWPVGVSWDGSANKFRARCQNPFTKEREHLGLFKDQWEAHEAWRKRKHELAQLVAETESDSRVVESLKKRYSVEEWYKNNPKENNDVRD